MKDLINSMFDKVYCINMPTAHTRRTYMKMQLDRLNIPFEFYNAANTTSLFDKVQWETIVFLRNACKYDTPSAAIQQLGCLLSHYQIMYMSLMYGYEHILILEDDMAFIKQKNIISEYLEAAPKDFDVLHFELIFSSYDSSTNDYTVYKDKWINVKDTDITGWCMAGCYALSRKAMETYVANTKHPNFDKPVVNDNIDQVFRHLQTSNLNIYLPNKALCLQQQYIQGDGVNYAFKRCAKINQSDFLQCNDLEKCIDYGH